MRAPSFLTSLLIGLTVFIDGVDALRILNRHVDESNNQVEEAKEDAWAWEGGGNEEPPPERVFREYNDGMYEGIAHHDDEGEGGENFMPEEGDRYHNTVVTFVNELPDQSIEVYWEGGEDVDEHGATTSKRKFEGTLSPRGGRLVVNTNEGHEFSYEVDGERHYITILNPNEYGDLHVVLAGSREELLVRCDLRQRDDGTSFIGPLEMSVRPYWAPRGASRFMELVRRGYYDGTALNRVVPNFLVQFGIAKDVDLRNEYSMSTIFDDFHHDDNPKFETGYVSFAGSGPDSRTTEIFIVMPGTPQGQLDYFGTNSWETPFGVVVGDVERGVLTEIYSGYGDMSSMGGKGPDSSRIYDVDGYDYLRDEFPKLDYIDRCYIVDEESVAVTEEL